MPPPPRDKEREMNSSRSRSHRSVSPPAHGRKRSWLPASRERPQFDRSPSPKRKPSQLPQQNSGRIRSRSRSPRPQQRNFGRDGFKQQRSPVRQDQGFRQGSYFHQEKVAGGPQQSFRSRKRSISPRNRPVSPRRRSFSPVNQKSQLRNNRDHMIPKRKEASPPPAEFGRYQQDLKKKSRRSPSPPMLPKKSNQRRSPSPLPHPTKKQAPPRSSGKDGPATQKKVIDSSKRKKDKLTLDKRFSIDDFEPFHLNTKDNVTIAILRNPKAIPSDDVTVQKIFDSSLFKMVHKKTEGKKPIFDREEIKVWKHDEKLEDEVDFEEKRLIRVKSSSKKPSDSLTRMSPDLLRKSFGLAMAGNNFRSSSTGKSPNVKLNPQPDSRYESRYQKQLEKEKTDDLKRHPGEERRGRETDTSTERRKSNDLRDALDRRRSGKDEDFERPERGNLEKKKYHDHDDRDVVMEQDRPRFRDERGRGRGGFGRGRGMRQQWSPIRSNQNNHNSFPSRGRGFDRKDEFSRSPEFVRGRGRGGFRGRGRGFDRDRDFVVFDNDRRSPPIDSPRTKFAQHDDRYISPIRDMSRGHKFMNRGSFGMRGFHMGSQRGRGFKPRGGGRGFYNHARNSRSPERFNRGSFDRWADREWKHDMYDSVQSDDEKPHTNTDR